MGNEIFLPYFRRKQKVELGSVSAENDNPNVLSENNKSGKKISKLKPVKGGGAIGGTVGIREEISPLMVLDKEAEFVKDMRMFWINILEGTSDDHISNFNSLASDGGDVNVMDNKVGLGKSEAIDLSPMNISVRKWKRMARSSRQCKTRALSGSGKKILGGREKSLGHSKSISPSSSPDKNGGKRKLVTFGEGADFLKEFQNTLSASSHSPVAAGSAGSGSVAVVASVGAYFIAGGEGAGESCGVGAVEAGVAKPGETGGICGTLRAVSAVCGVVSRQCFGSGFHSFGCSFAVGAGTGRGTGDASGAVADFLNSVVDFSATVGASSISAVVSDALSVAAATVFAGVGSVVGDFSREAVCAGSVVAVKAFSAVSSAATGGSPTAGWASSCAAGSPAATGFDADSGGVFRAGNGVAAGAISAAVIAAVGVDFAAGKASSCAAAATGVGFGGGTAVSGGLFCDAGSSIAAVCARAMGGASCGAVFEGIDCTMGSPAATSSASLTTVVGESCESVGFSPLASGVSPSMAAVAGVSSRTAAGMGLGFGVGAGSGGADCVVPVVAAGVVFDAAGGIFLGAAYGVVSSPPPLLC
ncbi:hypothetical protein ACOSP7_018514 [Xanthoceras sorbifolium]